MSEVTRLVLAVLLLFSPVAATAGTREGVVLGPGWRFMRGEVPGAAAPGFEDKDWSRVTLPHSFNAGEGGDGTYYRGPGWYRRGFDVVGLKPGRRLFVQFDAAATAADVFLNGQRIGRHEGGHSAFRFDLTPALKAGRNVLAVRVDNGKTRTITPLGGDFTIFGGLYRPVSLIEVDDVHVDLGDHGGPGVYARASDIGPASARVSVDVRVANRGGKRARVPVVARIVDAGGSEVARGTGVADVPAGAVQVARLNLRLPGPRRWDGVRDPYLYRVAARLGSGDEVTVPLGVRTFRFDAERGFILNDKPYPLRGANLMHSARPEKGTAVTRAEIAEDFAILREMGSTAVRLVHFQHPQASLEEADRIGLAAWTELGINSEIEDTPAFRANAARQMRELIAQGYNHPSVVLWGIGNEVYSEERKVARILGELHGIAKAADPSRPTAYAHCCQADDHPKALVSDVIGFNRYFGWYADQSGDTIGKWAERFHAQQPKRPFAVSEYGAGGSILHQADPPGPVDPPSGWHPEQYQAEYHERNWAELADKPYLWGTFVWVAFDLHSAGRHEGDARGINDKGLVTLDRQTRKDAYHWYRANWSGRPMLHITSRRLVERSVPEAEVKAYTNAGAASLWLNGVPVGTRAPVGRIVRWPVRLREGVNRIEVRGGSGLADAVEWVFRPAPGMVREANPRP